VRAPLSLLLGALALFGLGCQRDVVRPKQRAPSAASFAVTVHQSPRLTSVPSDTLGPSGEPTRVACVTCHARVDVGARASSPADLKEFHTGLTFRHGTLECGSCHAVDEPPLLRLATGAKLPTSEALALCSQCHGPQRRSFDHGAHGGMTGHWDLSRGPRERNHCVDCHDPHVPAIPKVAPVLAPIDRGHNPRTGHAHKEHAP
jgi:hypothetical protein